MAQSKDILFYSNFCEFSKSVLVLIQKKDCRENYVLVCVDNPQVKSKLPKEVDHVPMIITKTKHVISGDNIIKYVDTFSSLNSAKSQQPLSGVSNETNQMSLSSHDSFGPEPAAFSLASDMNSISETFTFIGSQTNNQDNRLRGFDYLQGHSGTMNANMDSSSSMQSRIDSEKKSKIDEAYEKYISDRDADISRIFGNKRPIRS